ncbi:MAG: PEP-utilizing enzyme, partial [Acidobacteriota bacterium]
LWIVQARQLVLTRQDNRHIPPQVRTQPILSGGVGVYPGRVSGVAYLAHDLASLGSTPPGAILFLRKASPDIAEVLPRISGLVAEWGNLTGHAAALLREFRIPSAFQMAGAFETVRPGTPVSLDAVKPRVYTGTFWPASRSETPALQAEDARQETPIESCLLRLHLLDSSAIGFRPGACRSAHDVLRYCHQTAIHAMFTLNDGRLSREGETASRLVTSAPIDLRLLDLGGGLAASARGSRDVRPEQIVSRPFRFLWQGMTGPAAECRCDQPIGLADLASVMTTSLSHCPESGRALGESGYLIVAAEYMNLNARLAYHFALMDACITDTPRNNSISFRFAGGGASRNRRDLRARFLERCLAHYGFQVRCRGDLVDAWYRKAPATEMEHRLEMLGSLIAWSSRLDMYMSSYQVMDWYRKRFLERNAMIPPGGLVCETCGSVAETPDRHEVSA